ncbi:DUF1127 domain-containing protein [Pelagibius litoralis]|uniref:DUF1127 domain-containing protein n=1 Tax=Pelagibius litoralis TaxID=374515 RepID=UPI00197DB0F7|nr:DUF1127 domain-containing protein [Pelagibius litoralis]
MTSFTKGVSPGAPASLPYLPGRAPYIQPDLGRPDVRWRHGRGLLSQALLGGFFLLARPLIAWQQRLETRERLRDMPDYLLRDIGLKRENLE